MYFNHSLVFDSLILFDPVFLYFIHNSSYEIQFIYAHGNL